MEKSAEKTGRRKNGQNGEQKGKNEKESAGKKNETGEKKIIKIRVKRERVGRIA